MIFYLSVYRNTKALGEQILLMMFWESVMASCCTFSSVVPLV